MMARHLFPGDLFLVEGTANAALLGAGVTYKVWSARTGGTDYSPSVVDTDGVTPLVLDGSGFLTADSDGKRPTMYGPDNVLEVWVDAGSGTRYPVYAEDALLDVMTNGTRLTSANNWTGTQNFAAAVDFDIAPTVNGAPIATGGGGGGGGAVASTDITDSSVVGRAVLTAADAAAARTAIGAGTGNGTSTLVIGTTAGTAMAGNTNLGAAMAQVANLVAFLNASGGEYIVRVNPTTGLWPNSGARVHASGAAMTGFTSQWVWNSMTYIGALKPAGMIDTDIWDQRTS